MFTENELVNFTTITSYFENECKRVVSELKDITNGFYQYLVDSEEFIYNSQYKRVECYADHRRTTYLGSFPISFLLKSGNEIREIIDKESVTMDKLDISKLRAALDELVGEQGSRKEVE